jgi:hypothetical protein
MSILRQLFGPSKEEIWQQLSREIDATYVPGSFWTPSKVVVQHGEWTITFDTLTVNQGEHSATYTRLRAPYVNADSFRFTIYRKGLFSDLGKWFGMQDVVVGDAQFDDEFIIQGSDEKKLRALLAHPPIRALIAAQPTIHFSVKDDEGWFAAAFPKGVDELYFRVPGVIQDVERLKGLYALFGETLDHLCRIGSAYEDDPGVAL